MHVVPFLLAMGLFVLGMWLCGIAPGLPGVEAVVFFGGILCIAAALAIPLEVLGRSDSAVGRPGGALGRGDDVAR